MPYDPHGHRLNWKYPERDKVIARAVELRQATPTLTSLDALMQAQELLPQERRKKRFTHYFTQQLLKLLAAEEARLERRIARAEAKAQVQEMPAPEPEPAPAENESAFEAFERTARTPVEQYAIPPQESEPEAPAPEPLSPLVLLCREVGSVIGSALARELPQLAPILMDAMRETLAAQLAAATPIPEAMIDFEKLEGTAPQGRPVRPRVAVVGLLPPQQQTVQHTFPQIDFRWLDHSAPSETVKSVASNCQEVYLMTKFIRHHTQNATPREKRVMVNGGVTDLTRIISARYARNGNGSAHAH